ncbi:MAG: DUF3500 domain-containing protein [Rhodospirillales bacterium]
MLVLRSLLLVVVVGLAAQGSASAHSGTNDPATAAQAFLDSLTEADRMRASLAFDDPQRTAFRWTPGRRAGVVLQILSPESRAELQHLLTLVLSARGALTVDAILATEAALGLLEGRPDYRNPELYYTAVFGRPGGERWGLRFEGHHLSINLTFTGSTAISGTPLVLGANPESVIQGPHAGTRALAEQVDLAWDLYAGLTPEQQTQARDAGAGFDGFLTRPGSLRRPEAQQAGIAWADLTAAQREALTALAVSYIGILGADLSESYVAALLAEEAAGLHFHWSGGAAPGGTYYYRIAGPRLFIEHNAMNGGTHIHAIWRDGARDWGGSE